MSFLTYYFILVIYEFSSTISLHHLHHHQTLFFSLLHILYDNYIYVLMTVYIIYFKYFRYAALYPNIIAVFFSKLSYLHKYDKHIWYVRFMVQFLNIIHISSFTFLRLCSTKLNLFLCVNNSL